MKEIPVIFDIINTISETNLQQLSEMTFSIAHLVLSSIVHMYLFQFFPLFFHRWFDVINGDTEKISKII